MEIQEADIIFSRDVNFFQSNAQSYSIESRPIMCIKQQQQALLFPILPETIKMKTRIFSTDSSEIRDENETIIKKQRNAKEDSSGLRKNRFQNKKYHQESEQQKENFSEQVYYSDKSSQVKNNQKSKKIKKPKIGIEKIAKQIKQKQEDKQNSSSGKSGKFGKAKKGNDYPTKNMPDFFWKKITDYLSQRTKDKNVWSKQKLKTGSLVLFTQLFQRQQLTKFFQQLFESRHLVRVIISSSVQMQKKKEYLRHVNTLHKGFLMKKIEFFN